MTDCLGNKRCRPLTELWSEFSITKIGTVKITVYILNDTRLTTLVTFIRYHDFKFILTYPQGIYYDIQTIPWHLMAVCILGKYIIPILIIYTGVLSEYSPSETALNFSPHQVNYGVFLW